MQRIKLADNLSLSRIIHGHWRLAEWNMTAAELLAFTEQAVEMGVTSFDHADIYGNYTCEALFGSALKLAPEIREKIEIVTKTGIKLLSDKHPERRIPHYDFSFDHIIASVEQSLRNFDTDYIDLLLLHRPSPLFDAQEVARAFSHLKDQGKVQHFGVSNFTAGQFDMLSTITEEPLVTNQLELSPYCLTSYEDGNMDYLQQYGIKPMAWSPLAGGNLMHPQDEKGVRIAQTLHAVANELDIDGIDKVIYSWLLMQPLQIMPIVGSGKINRLRGAVEALDIDMTVEQWFRIYTASTGCDVP